MNRNLSEEETSMYIDIHKFTDKKSRIQQLIVKQAKSNSESFK